MIEVRIADVLIGAILGLVLTLGFQFVRGQERVPVDQPRFLTEVGTVVKFQDGPIVCYAKHGGISCLESR